MNRKKLSKTPWFLWFHSSLDSLIINLSRVRDNATKDWVYLLLQQKGKFWDLYLDQNFSFFRRLTFFRIFQFFGFHKQPAQMLFKSWKQREIQMSDHFCRKLKLLLSLLLTNLLCVASLKYILKNTSKGNTG